jgi:hypothetical protein
VCIDSTQRLRRVFSSISNTKTKESFKEEVNHIRKEFTNGDDIGDALEDKQEVNLDAHKPSITMSQAQDAVTRDKEDQENEKIFEAQVRVFVARQAMYATNKRKAFALIYE